MKFTGRAHELEVAHGYRSGYGLCKCGWVGKSVETVDEILLDYRKHIKGIHARIR